MMTMESSSRARRSRPACPQRSPRGMATSSPCPPLVERHHRNALARANRAQAGRPEVRPEPGLVRGPLFFVEENGGRWGGDREYFQAVARLPARFRPSQLPTPDAGQASLVSREPVKRGRHRTRGDKRAQLTLGVLLHEVAERLPIARSSAAGTCPARDPGLGLTSHFGRKRMTAPRAPKSRAAAADLRPLVAVPTDWAATSCEGGAPASWMSDLSAATDAAASEALRSMRSLRVRASLSLASRALHFVLTRAFTPRSFTLRRLRRRGVSKPTSRPDVRRPLR